MNQQQNINEIENISKKLLRARKNVEDMEIVRWGRTPTTSVKVLKKLEDKHKRISEGKGDLLENEAHDDWVLENEAQDDLLKNEDDWVLENQAQDEDW